LKKGAPVSEQQKSQMVLGFNHNIKHKGRIYHVQTEDSGVHNPHIITHLFVGGNILATKKTSYADIVHADNLQEIVRELMEEQHKAMLRNLVNGVYDDIDGTAAQAAGRKEPAQPEPAQPEPAQPEPAQPEPAPPPVEPAPPPPVRPEPPPVQPAQPPPAATASAPEDKFPPAAPARPKTAPPPRTEPAIPVHEATTQPFMPAVAKGAQPAEAGGEEVRGTKIHKPPPPEVVPASGPGESKPAGVTIRASGPSAGAPDAKRDLPPEVVAARRLAERPTPKDTSGPTIFGEDLITEKSLDEVILGYLSGEGEDGS
jgi:hypothetical protein